MECDGGCHLGQCVEGLCQCPAGYFNLEGATDCSTTVDSVYPTAWALARLYVAALHVVLLVACSLGLYHIKNSTCEFANMEGHLAVVKIRRAVFLITLAYCCVTILTWCVDPFGYLQIWPTIVGNFLTTLELPFTAVIMAIILFHWREIYTTAIENMKKELMLENINSNYKSTLSMTQLVSHVHFVGRLKIPLIAMAFLSFALHVARACILSIGGIGVSIRIGGSILVSFFYFFIFLSGSIGFFLHGKKVTQALPDTLAPHIQRFSRRMTLLAVGVMVLAPLEFIALGFSFHPIPLMVSITVSYTIWTVVIFAMLAVFMGNMRTFFLCDEVSQTGTQEPHKLESVEMESP